MKFFIGRLLLSVGGWLWTKGGWTGDECYEDLTVTGKLGYHIFCEGVKLVCGSLEIFNELDKFIATEEEGA